jgi:O-acetyl-ADP-ribose deacetylase (regulator of RNase III)
MSLSTLVTTRLTPSFRLVVCKGSVLDYAANSDRSAIVNAANEECLGGGGVDGAITSMGGINLAKDRRALPLLEKGVRCRTGSAVITGPNKYDPLPSYIIHAVGPNYWDIEEEEQGHELLASAYQTSLDVALEHKIEFVGFSLLSAGVYRANVSLDKIFQVSVNAIQDWATKNQAATMNVTLCAFSEDECSALKEVIEKRTCIDNDNDNDIKTTVSDPETTGKEQKNSKKV